MANEKDLPASFRFGSWAADPSADELSQGDRVVKLEPRTMRLLVALAEAKGGVVTTERLFDAVWPGLVVTLSSLYEAVAQLRKALGPGHVTTVARKGYRLVTPVIENPPTPSSPNLTVTSEGTSAPKLGNASVAVMPFRLRNVPDSHSFLRESLTEDLITELSRQPMLVVVARGTMLSYGSSAAIPEHVARELGVRQVVDGLVEARGEMLHISVQVVDGLAGTQTAMDEISLPTIQWPRAGALVISRLARALNFEFFDQAARELQREAGDSLSALTFAMRAWIELFARTETPDSHARALDFASRALVLDPRSALGSTCMAFAHWRSAQFGWGPHDDPVEQLRLARAHIDRAIELNSREPDAYYVSGLVAYSSGETGRAEEALRHCLRLSSSHAPAFGLLALIRTRRGHPEEAAALCERAFALSPREPLRVVWHLSMAWAALALCDWSTALEESQRGMAVNPDFATCYITGTAAAHEIGLGGLVEQWIAFLQNRTAFKTLHAVRKRLPPASEAPHARQMDAVVEQLRAAGLPP